MANNPLNATDPTGRDTVHLRITGQGKLGRTLQAGIDMITDSDVDVGGGQGAIGVAISFPGLTGGEWDIGVTGSAGLTDVAVDPGDQSNGSPLPGLPGLSAGLELGLHSGSVSDLAGSPQFDIEGSVNIGKAGTRALTRGLARMLPRGALRDFVEGPLASVAEAAGGLAISGGASLNEDGDLDGFTVGVHKGLNTDISANVEATGVCSARSGCTGGD